MGRFRPYPAIHQADIWRTPMAALSQLAVICISVKTKTCLKLYFDPLSCELEMIIGRMRKHLVQQDWIAITVDVVVVLVGILLAFQIERWADELRSRSLEQDYLYRLKQDLETEVVRMNQAWDYAEDRIQAAKILALINGV